jgi:signal transduction histidine kinase
VEHFETIRQRKDGTLVPISLTISPIVDAGGRIVGASKIARDVTDRKEAEAERARLLELAQQASRLKDEFLATLSHELRTPLNAILGYARMVKDGVLTGDKQQRALNTIERNAAALAAIVNDVLDVSRIMSGKIVLNRDRVDLAALLQDSVDAVLPSAADKRIRIDVSVDGPAWVSGDPARLQQVFWNLLSNAVKFTLPDGAIAVSLSRHDADREAVLTIRDTGVGIAAEFLPYIFERFSQGESGPTRERGGLGLGLSISRHLVQLHGGRIEAASAGVGQGTTMRVMLPLEAVAAKPVVRTRRRVATNSQAETT